MFPSTFELQLEEERVLIAFREPTSLDAVRALLASPGVPAELQRVAGATAAALRTSVPGSAVVLTDDHAPVESLTRRMIVRRDRLQTALRPR